MEKKKISKLVIQKETISNLSKNSQSWILGGYGEDDTWIPIITVNPDITCLFINCQKPSTKNDGGTCDSTVNQDVTCEGYC